MFRTVRPRTPNNARIGDFGVADGAGLVDVFVSETDVGGGRDILVRNIPFALPAVALDIPPILRRVIFVGEASLRRRLDFESVGLGAIDGGDYVVALCGNRT